MVETLFHFNEAEAFFTELARTARIDSGSVPKLQWQTTGLGGVIGVSSMPQGSRSMRRTIVAEEILRGRVKKGETVKITSDGRKLIFSGLSEVSKVAKGTEL